MDLRESPPTYFGAPSSPQRRKVRLLTTLLAIVVLLPLAAATASAEPSGAQLSSVRSATAGYHRVERALADGYVPVSACTEVPQLGGMGIHYLNPALVADPAIDPRRPELLLYQPTRHGLRLVAVEYFSVDADQDLTTDADRPSLFGTPFHGPMVGHEPGMPIHYDLHVWLWRHNPDGMVNDWNPRVGC